MVHFAHQHHFSLELSLTVPITNSLAFLFTVLGDWYVDGKIISRDTWIGMALVCAGIGWVLVARSHLEILGAAGSPDLLTRSPGCVSCRKHELCRGILCISNQHIQRLAKVLELDRGVFFDHTS
jgi:Putative transmembrane family 234